MNQLDKARLIGISQGYLWRIYNGYAKPGDKVLPFLVKATGKSRAWWRKARLGEIQKVIDAIG